MATTKQKYFFGVGYFLREMRCLLRLNLFRGSFNKGTVAQGTAAQGTAAQGTAARHKDSAAKSTDFKSTVAKGTFDQHISAGTRAKCSLCFIG